MSSLLPLATYNLALQPFQPAPAIEDEYPVTIRLTLAAVDPESVDEKAEPSTLRMLKRKNPFIDDDEFDEDDEDDEAEEDDELDDGEDEDEDEDNEDEEKDAEEGDDDEDEDDENDEDEDDEVAEFVVCTLSPKTGFQQTLDLTISPEEEVYFVVTGSYPIHLTGNYVEHPADDDSEDDEDFDEDDEDDDEYDLTPDEDELAYNIEDLEDESDVEGKIEELVEEEETNKKRSSDEKDAAPTKKSKKDNQKKEDKKSVQFSKELEQGPTGSTLVEKKAEKKDKKAEKKAIAAEKKAAAAEEKKAAAAAEDKKTEKKYPTKTLLGGVITEDRKTGKGPQAKSGNKVSIRYIGKLKNGKVFDKNTSGKPFSFGLGKGECIKGFDLGVAGMAVGGERRVVIPPKMGYGSQALPGIPANSELIFDIKLVSIK